MRENGGEAGPVIFGLSPATTTKPAQMPLRRPSKESSPHRYSASPNPQALRRAGYQKEGRRRRSWQLTANKFQSPRRAHIPAQATTPAAITPASVPVALIAPSRPGCAARNVVIIRGFPPNTCPISDETVSAAASASAASAKASSGARAWAARSSQAESMSQNCAGPVDTSAANPRFAATCDADRPLRFSAVPRLSFFARPTQVERKARNATASTGVSAVCQGWYGNATVENMRLAVITAPVSAPAGVAARSRQVTSPRTALSPIAHIATATDSAAHSWQPRKTCSPRKGQHHKQHQLRLPVQFFLSHASSYPFQINSEPAPETDAGRKPGHEG